LTAQGQVSLFIFRAPPTQVLQSVPSSRPDFWLDWTRGRLPCPDSRCEKAVFFPALMADSLGREDKHIRPRFLFVAPVLSTLPPSSLFFLDFKFPVELITLVFCPPREVSCEVIFSSLAFFFLTPLFPMRLSEYLFMSPRDTSTRFLDATMFPITLHFFFVF